MQPGTINKQILGTTTLPIINDMVSKAHDSECTVDPDGCVFDEDGGYWLDQSDIDELHLSI